MPHLKALKQLNRLPHLWPWLLAAFLWLPGAANGEPKVEENYARVDFPNSATFYLSLSSQVVIEKIELEYGVTQLTCGSSSALARPEFEPATQVKTRWNWDFRKSGSPPPGARLWWRWHIGDAAGRQVELAEQELFVTDPRFEWQETRSAGLALFSALADQAVNQALWQAANEALARLERDAGALPTGLIKIYNYPDTRSMRSSVVYTRDWTGGLALPAYQTILLGVNQKNLAWGKKAVTHELAHLITGQITFNCLGNLPRWLDEGLAAYSEGDWDDHSQALFDQVVAQDELLSLRSLSGTFPTSGKRADLAYAQSRQVVSYLLDVYGPEKMAQLLQSFKMGSSYDQALQQVYGFNTVELDNTWRRSMGLAPRRAAAMPSPQARPTLAPYGAATPSAAATSQPSPTRPPAATLTPTTTALPAVTALAAATRSLRPAAPPATGSTPAAAPSLTWLWLGAALLMAAIGALLVLLRRL